MLAPSIEWLWFARALQGMSAGGRHGGGAGGDPRSARWKPKAAIMARVALLFAIAPAVAPMFGGAILAVASGGRPSLSRGLRPVADVGIVEDAAGDAAAGTPDLHPVGLGKAYLGALRSLPFVLLVFAVSFNFQRLNFVHVLSAPVFPSNISAARRRPWLVVHCPAWQDDGRIAAVRADCQPLDAGARSPPAFAVMACATLFNLGLNAAVAAADSPGRCCP